MMKVPSQLLLLGCMVRDFLFQSCSEIGSSLTVGQWRIMRDHEDVTWMEGVEGGNGRRAKKGAREALNQAGDSKQDEGHHRAPLEADAAVPILDDVVGMISGHNLLGPQVLTRLSISCGP